MFLETICKGAYGAVFTADYPFKRIDDNGQEFRVLGAPFSSLGVFVFEFWVLRFRFRVLRFRDLGASCFGRRFRVLHFRNYLFHKHLRPSCGAERKFVKKNYRSEFLQSSFIFVLCILKEVYRKIMSEIHFVGKTRYKDLTETGS